MTKYKKKLINQQIENKNSMKRSNGTCKEAIKIWCQSSTFKQIENIQNRKLELEMMKCFGFVAQMVKN